MREGEEGADAREGAVDEAYRTALAYWFPERWPAAIHVDGRLNGKDPFRLLCDTGGSNFMTPEVADLV